MKDKALYKKAVQIAWPSVLESFFIAFAGMIDTFMVARLGNSAVAAVGLTTQPKFIAFSIFFAINTGVSALVARRKGQEDKRGANVVFTTAFVLSMFLCIATIALFLGFSDEILRFAGSNVETHVDASKYFYIIIGGMFFNIFAMLINSAQRGSGNTKIAFTTNLVSSIVNITFNYLLIEGNFGFQRLGIEGAAIATVIGSAVAAVMSFISLFNKNTFVDIKLIFRRKVLPSIEALKSIFSLSFSIYLENMFMRVGFLVTSISAANLGTDPFAAYNVGMNILSIGFSFGDGMQVAAVALSGRALGVGNKDEAFNYGHICQRIGFVMSVFLSFILLVFGRDIFKIFFGEQTHLLDMGVNITRLLTIIIILQISQIIYGGCLRSGGDVKYTLISGIISVTIVRTSVTLLLTSVLDWGLTGIFIGILVDQLTRYLLLRRRFNNKQWLNISI